MGALFRKRVFRVSAAYFILAIALVNGANEFLVPLVSKLLPADYSVYIEAFLTVALNALVIFLSTEEQQSLPVPPAVHTGLGPD